MRSLFAASAIMLMLFNYIEISSGMDLGEKKKGKGVKLFGQYIDESPKKNPALRMSMDSNRRLRLHNDDNGESVDREHTGLHMEGKSTGLMNLQRQKSLAVRLDWDNALRVFDPEKGVFEGDDPYPAGSREYKHARALQKAYIKDQIKQRAAVAEEASNVPPYQGGHERVLDPRTGRLRRKYADHLLQNYHSNAAPPHRSGLFREISYAGQVEIANKMNEIPNVDTNHPGYAHLAGFEPNFSKQKHRNLLHQQGFPYVSTHNQEQAHVAGNDPFRLNQGHDGNYQPTPRVRSNSRSSGQSAHNQYYQGPPGYYGQGY